MPYTTWREVRAKSSQEWVLELGITPYGAADGTNKTFYVTPFICDKDGDEDVDVNDVTVYDDGVAVAVTSIDASIGKIVLTNAPAASSVMTVDYARSDIRETDVASAIAYADAMIDKRTRTKGSASNSYTQYWDGDGEKTIFYFDRWPVTAISSYDVDGTTSGLTEGTDYYLLPTATRALWVEFDSAPNDDHKNIAIVYTYGETSYLIGKLSTYIAAIDILLNHVSKGSSGGVGYIGKEGTTNYPGRNKFALHIQLLERMMMALWKEIGGSTEIDVV